MPLTDEQALYVEKVEAQRKALVNCFASAAHALLAHRRNLMARIEANADMHAVVYGALDGEAGKSIEAELKAASASVAALFDTGLIAKTLDQMEAELSEQPPRPMPGF